MPVKILGVGVLAQRVFSTGNAVQLLIRACCPLGVVKCSKSLSGSFAPSVCVSGDETSKAPLKHEVTEEPSQLVRDDCGTSAAVGRLSPLPFLHIFPNDVVTSIQPIICTFLTCCLLSLTCHGEVNEPSGPG